MEIYNPLLSQNEAPAARWRELQVADSGALSPAPTEADRRKGAASEGFETVLKESMERLNESQLSADNSVVRLAAGEEGNMHRTMIELERAEISLRMAMQVRSKVLDAYQQLTRINI